MSRAKQEEFGPWNPGLTSTIPRDLLPKSTIFDARNVETGFEEAHELADFCGLKPIELVVFRLERLIIHGLLIRVTTTLSVPDGPNYEELGINLRGMVRTLYEKHITPELPALRQIFKTTREDARRVIRDELKTLRSNAGSKSTVEKSGWLERLLGSSGKEVSLSFDEKLAKLKSDIASPVRDAESAARKALLRTVNAIVAHRGRLVGDDETIIKIATGFVLNDWGSRILGDAVAPLFEKGAKAEGYRFLPDQDHPFIMNVKGSSASGKSTIRPRQRELATKLGIAWEDFALISPDYWRKYLLDYESLGNDHKYGAMLTGHELTIIDKKLDRQMSRRAQNGKIPHLLVDRFRFDSFSIGDDQSSQLLTRFGDTVYMFFMITPPEATVERAYLRGLTTGRYKAVDDLLDHNIEAYEGMPGLFFSWALSGKKVHYEFLDNSVEKNETPRTVAFGWNAEMTIFDVRSLLNVERFKHLDVDATNPSEIYLTDSHDSGDDTDFLKAVSEQIETVHFALADRGLIYGTLKSGKWIWRNQKCFRALDKETQSALRTLGWDECENDTNTSKPPLLIQTDTNTLGSWERPDQ